MTQLKALLFVFIWVLIALGCTKNGTTVPVDPEASPTVKAAATYTVNRTSGITYAEGLSHTTWNSASTTVMPLKLDIYVPQNSVINRPALVLIHGGGLNGGSRTNPRIVAMADYFASRGWVVLSLDYRLRGNKGTVPALWEQYAVDHLPQNQIVDALKVYPANRDVKAAVRWLYANTENYHINTNFITAGGNSAGAFLSVTLGTTEGGDFTDELSITEDPTLATTHIGQPSEIHTIIDFWGSENYVRSLEQVYQIQRLDANDAPILIIHGTADAIVPFSNAEALQTTYQSTGVNYAFYPLQDQEHEAWDALISGKTLSEMSFEFIVAQQALIVE